MRIGRLLGQDAVGAWHRAEDTQVPGTVRILRADRANDDGARLLMVEELRRVATLDHPYLIHVHKQDPRAPRPWMLTESIEGESLSEHLDTHGPLAEQDALDLATGILGALEHLAQRRQVHGNVIAERVRRCDGEWRLMTFRDVRARDELKTLKGRPYAYTAWLPPERSGDHPAAFGPDAYISWAVGGILRAALCGSPPTGALPETCPGALRPRVLALTAPNPGDRPQGIEAVRRALAGDLPGRTPSPASTPSFDAPVPRRKRRR